MAGAIDDLAIVISASTQQLAADLRVATRMFTQFHKEVGKSSDLPTPPPKPPKSSAGDLAAKLAKDMADSQLSARRLAGDSVKAIGRQARGAAADLAALAVQGIATGGSMLALEAGVSGVAGAFSQLKESISLAAEVEQNRLAFEVMLGSADQANKKLQEIRQFAATTPFSNRETVDATRQLIAYGIAADDALKHVKMLGDISAGSGGRFPLGDLAYVYGTLATQGRAFSKDIYQFTNRGIDVLTPLAKEFGVVREEVMGLVEEGRVGFPEVGRALQQLRGPGGAFFQMAARQGQTLRGVWEQLSDTASQMKTRFGEIVIEEVGLKDAFKDLDAFTKRIEEGMDRLRGPIRLAGQLARAVAQLGNEAGKAAGLLAEIRIGQIDAVFPEIRHAAEAFQQLVKDAANFQLDPEVVAKFAFASGRALLEVIARILDGVAEFGPAFQKNVVSPIRDAADKIEKIINETYELAKKVGLIERPPGPGEAPVGRRDKDKIEGIDRGTLQPPVKNMSPERILAEWQAISKRMAFVQGLVDNYGKDDHKRWLADIQDLHNRYLGGFAVEPDFARRALNEGNVPPLKGGWGDTSKPQEKTQSDDLKEFAQGIRGRADALDKFEGDWLKEFRAGREQEATAKRVAGERKAAEETARTAFAMKQLRGELGGFPLLPSLVNPLGGVVADAAKAKADMLAETAAMAAGGFGAGAIQGKWSRGINPDAPTFPERPSADLLDFAKGIREKYDPMPEIKRYRDQLGKAMKFGLIDAAEYKRADHEHVRDVAAKFGVGGHYQLPDAITVGTAEDAAWQNRLKVGQEGQQTTEQLLDELVRVTKEWRNEQKGQTKRIVEAAPIPLTIAP